MVFFCILKPYYIVRNNMRKKRIKSSTGLYHVVIRGVNKQAIFLDSEDRKIFLSLMKKYRIKHSIKIHAFSLMDNHVHILLEDMDDKLSSFMQILASVYARFFNKKYDRVGHLYQDRFLSEVIENQEYFLTVFRYVLQNPLKAHLCHGIDYAWNSYKYLYKKSNYIDTHLIYEILGSKNNIDSFLRIQNTDECIDMSLRPSEKELSMVLKIKKILKTDNPVLKQDIPKSLLYDKIKLLRKAGLSINSIARVTGVGRYLIQKAGCN